MSDLYLQDVLDSLYAALEAGRGWSLVRAGDGELRVLNRDAGLRHPHLEGGKVSDESSLHWLAGESERAMREADYVGAFRDVNLAPHLERLGIGEDRRCYPWSNLHLGLRRSFVERVLRRPMFLVGNPMAAWAEQVLLPRGLGVGSWVHIGNQYPATRADAEIIMQAVSDTSAQVVLCSLGIWSLPICHYAKSIGKIGIDYGHAPDHHLFPVCEGHRERWIPDLPTCPKPPACQAHWRYMLNTCCEDSAAGTMEHYRHAGAPLCLPERPE